VRRIAVTGIGVVSPLGHGAHEIFENARLGRSAVRVSGFTFDGQWIESLAAPVEFDGAAHFEPATLRMLDRVSQFAAVAGRRAMIDAQRAPLAGPERELAGVFLGTGMGASNTLDASYRQLYEKRTTRLNPMTIIQGMQNAPAAWIAAEHHITGPTCTYSTACSSAAVAIGEAWQKLATGQIDLAIAGGAEAPLSIGSVLAWSALRAVANIDPERPSASCKPFARNRSGMVLGEGAAMLVLEPLELARARGATVHGEISGCGMVTDIAHITRPSIEAQAATLRAALRSAQLDIADIDAINAHGTGTQANDVAETAAIRHVFGSRSARIAVSGTKAIHGHMLGAGAAFECVLSLLSMQHRVLLPTMHLGSCDPQCDLDYVPNAARHDVDVRTMLSNSFAFGGNNVVLVLRAAA
jgi:3-oxoacyl-[acyl-carrier-protein] synthase II